MHVGNILLVSFDLPSGAAAFGRGTALLFSRKTDR